MVETITCDTAHVTLDGDELDALDRGEKIVIDVAGIETALSKHTDPMKTCSECGQQTGEYDWAPRIGDAARQRIRGGGTVVFSKGGEADPEGRIVIRRDWDELQNGWA